MDLHKLLMLVSSSEKFGLTYSELYNLPVYLRGFYLDEWHKQLLTK